MDTRILRYFLAVAREKNITRAAEILHISQPSLSKQLMDFEEQLGKKLFIRGKRKITLTEEGALLSKRAEEIIMLLEKTEQEITSDSKIINGNISIGGGIGLNSITKTASNLVSRYPEIRYDLISCDAEEAMERLDNGTLDFGILIEPVDVLKYEYISLPEVNNWGLLMRKDSLLAENNSVSQEDIKDFPLIIPKRTELQRELSRWMQKDILNFNVIGTYNLLFSNTSLFVKNGLGYAFSLDKLLYLEENSELCFRPFNPRIEVKFCIAWKKYRTLSKTAEKFAEEIKKTSSL